MPKRIKPGKPLRDSLTSHKIAPEEEVRTFTAKLQSFVEGREVLIFSILAVVVLIFGGGGVVWFLKSNEESLATDRLGAVYADYRKALFGDPMTSRSPAPPVWEPGDLEQKALALARLAEDHEGSRAGTLAEYLAGNAYLRAGEPEKAIPLLETAVKKIPPNRRAHRYALAALGAAYEDEGEAEKALAAYQDLTGSLSPRFRVDGLLGSARALWALERKEEALVLFEKARSEFPEVAGDPSGALEVRTRDLDGLP